MRTLNASMMDAAGTRPDDLAHAQRHLVEASLPDAAHPKRAPLPLMPVARLLALHSLLRHVATSRSAQAMQSLAALPAVIFDIGAASDGFEIGGAVVQRYMSLHAQWLDGLTELCQEMSEVRQVNTLSKAADQEMSFLHQGLALLTGQATASLQLMENIQVDVAWWLSQRATAHAA